MRRTVLAARRAGFDRVYVLDGENAAISPVLEGTGALAFPREAPEAALPPGRIVLLPNRVVAGTQWLASLRETPVRARPAPPRSATGPSSRPTSRRRWPARSRAQSSLPSVLSEWGAVLPAGPPVEGVAAPLEVTDAAQIPAAEDLLLQGLVKKEDGILTRLISRKISLAVTRRIAATRITPNVMTLLTASLGLAAAWSLRVSRARPADRGRNAVPPAFDPGRLRRRARAVEVPGIAPRRHARLLGRQRRARRGLLRVRDRLERRERRILAAAARRARRHRNDPRRGVRLHVRDAAPPGRRRTAADDGLAHAAVAADRNPGCGGAARLHLPGGRPLALREGVLVPRGGGRGNPRVLPGARRHGAGEPVRRRRRAATRAPSGESAV